MWPAGTILAECQLLLIYPNSVYIDLIRYVSIEVLVLPDSRLRRESGNWSLNPFYAISTTILKFTNIQVESTYTEWICVDTG